MKESIIALLLILLTSCEKQKIIEVDKSKEIYILEKSTGELTLIDRDELIPVKEVEKPTTHTTYKNYKSQTVVALDSIECSLETNYYDGYMFYKFRVEPISEKIKERSSSKKFILRFTDKYGFRLYDVEIATNEMQRIMGSKKAIGYSVNSKERLSFELYKSFKNWSITWSGM
ncbi:MAG: hypothetical protein H8E98_08485 [Bacteroidetes bacterium]|nr:hypothetical protein [Bacteroidota bacterium]